MRMYGLMDWLELPRPTTPDYRGRREKSYLPYLNFLSTGFPLLVTANTNF